MDFLKEAVFPNRNPFRLMFLGDVILLKSNDFMVGIHVVNVLRRAMYEDVLPEGSIRLATLNDKPPLLDTSNVCYTIDEDTLLIQEYVTEPNLWVEIDLKALKGSLPKELAAKLNPSARRVLFM